MNEMVDMGQDESTPEQDQKIQREALLQKIDQFGMGLSHSRSTAIEGRQTSGIESCWREDEEYYEGIDDANRGERSDWKEKPLGTQASATGGLQPTGSTIFPNVTLAYVDTGSASTADILLPTDDKTWSLESTPVPDMLPIADGKFPAQLEAELQQAIPDQAQREAKKQELMQSTKLQMEIAREVAKKAEDWIHDKQVECQYHTKVRQSLEYSAKIGTGILKGPIPFRSRRMAFIKGELVMKEEINPITVVVDPWNFYPDPACGEDICNGSFTWEKDDITARKLEELIGTPGYITEQIEKCLVEGPYEACAVKDGEESNPETGLQKRKVAGLYQIWYYHGMAKRRDLEQALELSTKVKQPEDAGAETTEGNGQQETTEQPSEGYSNYSEEEFSESVYVQITMVNNRVIRMIQNPLDTGEFPYDLLIWQKRKGLPWGTGIARQIRPAQNIIKAGFRNMMDNGGAACGPQVIVNTEYVQPHDKIYEFTPWKIWQLVKNLDGPTNIDSVFRFIKVDMQQEEMQAIIQQGLMLAEYATGIPMIKQGQTNSGTPKTLGGMQIQDDNASRVLRRIGKQYDAMIERHVRRYYTYGLQYGPDDIKGDFTIQAKGGSARIEMAIQSQQLWQFVGMAANPTFGIDPKKLGTEIMRSMRIDADRIEFDDDKWQEVVANLAAPKGDSSIEVAKIREAGAAERDKMKIAAGHDLQASKEAIAERQIQAAQETELSRQQFALLVAELEQDVTAYTEAMANNRNTDSLKTKLADTTLKLKAQMQSQRQLLEAPTEPAGKAPSGQGFAK